MRVAFHTLGCKVNQYETQAIREQFLQDGFSEVGETECADVYVINTCTVTHLADRKSRQYIRKAKKWNPASLVVVTGCYAQMDPEGVAALDGVDLVCGTNEKGQIPSYVRQMVEEPTSKGQQHHLSWEQLSNYEEMGLVTAMEARTRAYIKIQEGCDRFCSYCIIPYARGPIRSRSPLAVVEEIKNVCNEGYQEIVLTGINTALYGRESGFLEKNLKEWGMDSFCQEEGLMGLINTIDGLPGNFRLRLGSLEPNVVGMEELNQLLRFKCVCHHLHFSLQSGSNGILQAMNRRYTREEYLEMVGWLHEKDPCYGITTDVIVGFPGEEESDFQDTLSMMEEVNFLKVHIFPYSIRKGTVAGSRKDQISPEIKKERVAALCKAAQKSQIRFLNQSVGHRTQVVVEEKNSQGLYVGFSDEYVRVYLEEEELPLNQRVEVVLSSLYDDGMKGKLISSL